MFNLSTGQVNSGLRHVYTVVGTALATTVAIGFITQGDATTISNAIHQIGDGVSSIAAGVGALIPVVSGIYAMISASRRNRLDALSKDPEIKQIVVATPAVADAVPSNKVVAQ